MPNLVINVIKSGLLIKKACAKILRIWVTCSKLISIIKTSWVPNCYIVKVNIGIFFVNHCAIVWVTQLFSIIEKNAM